MLLTLPESKTRVVYPLLRIENDNQDERVKKLFDFFDSDVAKRIFQQHGFRMLSESQQQGASD